MDHSGSYEVRSPVGNGLLRLYCEGVRCHADMTAPLFDKPLHLYCVRGDKAVSIGVPAPDRGRLRLNRFFSPMLLSPLEGKIEYCILAPRGFMPQRGHHEEIARDNKSDQAEPPQGWIRLKGGMISGLSPDCGAITGIYHGIQALALPFGIGAPFALPSLMRRGVPIIIERRKYLLYSFSGGKIKALNQNRNEN